MTLNMIKKNKLLTGVVLVYGILFIALPAQALASLGNSMYYIKEMFQVLPIVFVITAVIEAWVPKTLIMDKLGDSSGMSGNLLSLLLGSVSVGPIYAAFPISKMLLAKGASVGNIVIILSSWAVIKIPMLANEAKFLGVKFMAARWVLSVIAILIMARIVYTLTKRSDIPMQDTQHEYLVINDAYCIGCGICVKLLPNILEMKDNKAIVKTSVLIYDQNFAIVAGKCPTKAITAEEEVAGIPFVAAAGEGDATALVE